MQFLSYYEQKIEFQILRSKIETSVAGSNWLPKRLCWREKEVVDKYKTIAWLIEEEKNVFLLFAATENCQKRFVNYLWYSVHAWLIDLISSK